MPHLQVNPVSTHRCKTFLQPVWQSTMIPSPSVISNPELRAIFNKYHCDRPIPDGVNPFRLDEETQTTWDTRARQLKDKWAARIEPNWYGFEINNVPPNWLDAIDEALDYVQSVRADFTIKQVKLKFGGIRMYLNFYTGDAAGQQLHEDLVEFFISFDDPKLVW